MSGIATSPSAGDVDPRGSQLAGRVAVITGSTRGLGLAMARVLGRSGATVVVSSRDETHVNAAIDTLRAEGLDVTGVTCDITVLADVEALRDHARARGSLSIWVNNAGISGVYGPTASTPIDDFTRVVRTNVIGTFHGSRMALPIFLEQGFGDLVNLYGEGDNGLNWFTLITRGLRSALTGRLRAANRPKLEVSTLEPADTDGAESTRV
ncbi:SDR family NAD(P)-dependent oxidoreductase [Ruicaihuangia caeni]|uniref:SDR family NAD(P)-dependent oxidoreductase n=1 Tax=Ruicaihuangia caeni TaxID=3042517 RepID=UPI00338DF44D